MGNWKSLSVLLLLYCYSVDSKPSTEGKDHEDNKSVESSQDNTLPDNMNIVDYYFSIFGKHLDYDYREPLLTFDEPVQNELSDEDTDKSQELHIRQKRFILAPVVNATRRWAQQMRRLRMERRKLRMERRRQWQQNRINYLSTRSDNLKRQASRLKEQQRLNALNTRNVSTQSLNISKTPIAPNTTTKVPSASTSQATSTTPSDSLIIAASNSVPVKQVPVPTKN